MKQLRKLFTEHPATQGETYFEHARFALCVSTHLLISSACLACHALFPFIRPPEPWDVKSTRDFLVGKCKDRH